MKTISEILKAGRTRSGLTAIEAAAAFGVGKDVIYAWENGGAAPKLGVVLLICEAYGVTSSELLEAAAEAWDKPIKPITRPVAPASVFNMAVNTPPPRIEVGGGIKFLCIECNLPASQFGSKKARGGYRCMSCVGSQQRVYTNTAKPEAAVKFQ